MKIVAISGSLRAQSSNTLLLRAAASLFPGMELYDAMGDLPHFNPDLDGEGSVAPAPVQRLRETLIAADAILISCPEYAHGVPGTFKNLLDWLVSTGELVGKPVALLNASPSGGMYAQSQLLETLRTMNWKVIEEALLIEPFVPRKITSTDIDETSRERLRGAVEALVRQSTERRIRHA